jgi:hypothetical protein
MDHVDLEEKLERVYFELVKVKASRKKQPQYSQQVPSGRPSHGEFKKWLMSSLILLVLSIKPTRN